MCVREKGVERETLNKTYIPRTLGFREEGISISVPFTTRHGSGNSHSCLLNKEVDR